MNTITYVIAEFGGQYAVVKVIDPENEPNTYKIIAVCSSETDASAIATALGE